MGLPRFFKLPRNKQFNYQPLYYDQDKEERISREKRIARELGIDKDDKNVSRITRGSMKEYFKRDNRARKQSNLRLVFIAIILFIIAYLLLFA
jgi:hypothetical protein